MTFILGVSRLTYDYFDDWVNQQDAAAAAPAGIVGDTSMPGECSPGAFMPGEEHQDVRTDEEAA